jgi:phosphopantetheinyl transferase
LHITRGLGKILYPQKNWFVAKPQAVSREGAVFFLQRGPGSITFSGMDFQEKTLSDLFRKDQELSFVGGRAVMYTLSQADDVDPGAWEAVLVKLPLAQDILREAEHLLTMREHERFAEFHLEKRRMEWLAGRLAAKGSVWQWLSSGSGPRGIPLQELEILNRQSGRPYVNASSFAEQKMPYISISHSGNFAVAMAGTALCGIDVQRVQRSVPQAAAKFSTDPEKELIAGMNDLETGLTMLWSCKEAVRKMAVSSPLLGFHEIVLTEVRTPADSTPLRCLFSLGRPATGKMKRAAVSVWIRQDYILAMTTSEDTA